MIEAYDENDNLIGSPVADCNREVYSGAFEDLPAGNYFFKGWSEDINDERGLYTNMADIRDHVPGVVGQTKTLYAIYEQLYTIKYDGNGSTTGTMGEAFTKSGMHKGEYYYLNAPNFLRDDYGFIGWSMDKNAQPGGSSKIYGPNEMITLNQTITDGAVNDGEIIMYAIWVPKSTTYTLQTFNATTFELTNPNTTITALTDTRDGQTYAVAKLADGKWWMIENLRFNPTGKELNDENTNHPTASFVNTAKNLTTLTTPAACGDDGQYTSGCINKYSLLISDINSESTPSPTATSGQTYEFGAHYNWYTATAGNGAYSVTNFNEVTGDLCPAGWRLPSNHYTDSTKSDFSQLDLALGGNGAIQYHGNYSETETSYPNNFTYAGKAISRVKIEVGQRSTNGQYWGRTSGRSEEYASYYLVSISKNDIHYSDQGYLAKSSYLPIRCLAQ